jgi:hypothetical protein
MTAFFIASKCEEVDPPQISDLVRYVQSSVTRGRFFVHFFYGKFLGKFRKKFSPKKCWEKLEFSAEKVLKTVFARNSEENSAEKILRKIGTR